MYRISIFRALTFWVGATCLALSAVQAESARVIFSFTDTNGEGAFPVAPVIFDTKGAIYGTTAVGGAGGFGTVWALTPPSGEKSKSWTETILYDFSGGADGQQPMNITFGPGGVIYSTTYLGGSDNCYQGCGTIFELTPPTGGGGRAWTKQTLYEFLGGADGEAPGNIQVGADGMLFGVTGSNVWSLTESDGVWTKTIIHSFPASKDDGVSANFDIVFDANGNLYGTTYEGGSSDYGVVWELSPPAPGSGAWTETILHSFTGASTDGGYPIGGLTMGANGVVYGTASYSGVANDSGTAFALTPPAQQGGAWPYNVIHKFSGGKNGATPSTTMAIDASGNLYGTTWNGGSTACYLGCGTVFELAPPAEGGPWKWKILHNWANSNQDPDESIVVLHDGLLYGTSEFFGTKGYGTVFTMTP
jgi:uncharacterized repeat protein (TIGR03803 family)